MRVGPADPEDRRRPGPPAGPPAASDQPLSMIDRSPAAFGRSGTAFGRSPDPASPPAGSPESATPTVPGQTDNQGRTDNPARAADLLPSVSAPKGGGAIRGLDEKFSVNAATGTAAMTVPLPLSPGRSGFTPGLQLAYDSGSGNGPFGFGWSLGMPAITRKTDKGLPLYCDGDESDVFILAGAEDLVPVLDTAGGRKTADADGLRHAIPHRLLPPAHRRPLFPHRALDREQTPASATGGPCPAITSRRSTAPTRRARVADPGDPARIFSWQICRTWDDKGNAAVYSYAAEDGAGIDLAAAHEANRTPQRPRRADLPQDSPVREPPALLPRLDGAAGDGAPGGLDVLRGPRLRRSRRRAAGPASRSALAAAPRPVLHLSRRIRGPDLPACPAAPVLQQLPCRADGRPDCLVRSLNLVYSDQQAPADPRNPAYTFLVSATQTGYRHGGEGFAARSMPPLEFEYSQPQIQQTILTLDPGSQANLPEGLDGSSYRWVDLDGEGLSGILTGADGAGTTSGTSAPATWSPSPTGRSRPGPASDRWRPWPACRPAPTYPGCGCLTSPAAAGSMSST